jgi:DNA-binding transcriptional MerR regulator
MLNVAPSIFDVVSTSAVARELQVAENTIRSWERRGLLVPFTRLATGMRLYLRSDVERVRELRAAEATR